MMPVIEIKGNGLPTFSTQTNIRKGGHFLNEHANIYENELSEDISRRIATDVVCLWLSIRIPILISEIEFASSDITKCDLSVYKFEKDEYVRYFQESIEKSYIMENMSLVLEPGIYVFEISGCYPIISSKGYLSDIPISENMFIAIVDGIGSSLEEVGNCMPGHLCMGGIARISYKYRYIDTYLGKLTDVPKPDTLVPGAWFHLIEKSNIRIVLWTGSEYLTN